MVLLSTTTRELMDGERNQGDIEEIKKFMIEIAKSKFNHINFNFCDIPNILKQNNCEEKIDEIIKLCREYNINIETAHATFHWPFLFQEYESREDKEELENGIIKSIQMAKRMNVKWITLHLGQLLDKEGKYNYQESAKANIRYLNKFIELANDLEIGIAIENGTNMLQNVTPTIEELIEIVDFYNQLYKKEVLGICYDFGHANVGDWNQYESIKKIGKHLKVTHIHDNIGKDTHQIPFTGNIDFKSAMKALKEINYTGNLTLELKYQENEMGENCLVTLNKTYDILNQLKQI